MSRFVTRLYLVHALIMRRNISDLMNIENEYPTGRERCLRALEKWRRDQGDKASPQQLVRVAKYFRLNDLTGKPQHYEYDRIWHEKPMRTITDLIILYECE